LALNATSSFNERTFVSGLARGVVSAGVRF
jgi:hypothetical protein